MNQRRLDPNFLNGPVTGANIPMLPGFRVPEQKRQYHGKKHIFQRSAGGTMVVNSARDEACKDEAEAQMSARQRPQSARPFAPAAPAYAHQPAAPTPNFTAGTVGSNFHRGAEASPTSPRFVGDTAHP